MIRSFVKHLFPKKININSLKFRYTFHLGIVSTVLFFLLCISGVLLMLYYVPSTKEAYNSILYIEEYVFAGKFLRSFHRMCNHFFLITITLHLLRIIFSGIYKYRKDNYKTGFIIFPAIIFCAYTGYLLPMDQLSYWATLTGMELFKTLPFGNYIVQILTPDGVGGSITLSRFYTLHVVVLPCYIILLLCCHMYNLVRDKIFLKGLRVEIHILYRYINYIFIFTTIFIALLSLFLGSPLGFPANPNQPPNPAKSAWFLIWIQEMVSWNTFLFYIIPVTFVLYFFLPELSKRKERYRYFSKDDFFVWLSSILFVLFICCLTIIALFFRGENWQLKFSLHLL